MATPATKDALKEYCLMALGKPVIDVNVDPDQCDDRIDDALQYFAEYHMDGVERMYLKYKMTDAQITRGSTDATTNVTDTIDNTGGAYAWLEQKVWLPLPAPVISVLRIFPWYWEWMPCMRLRIRSTGHCTRFMSMAVICPTPSAACGIPSPSKKSRVNTKG